jgi:hypothetical protein
VPSSKKFSEKQGAGIKQISGWLMISAHNASNGQLSMLIR